MDEDLFKRGNFNYDKLLKYGFKEDNNNYIYSKNILNNTFRVDIIVDNNKLLGNIYDIETNLEYINYRLEDSVGKFVNQVRSEYNNILLDIKNNCFDSRYFVNDQTNRICNYIINKYHDIPLFMWNKFPGFGVFKNKFNNKWYGAVMNISKSVIDYSSNDEEIEIINLKINPDMINLLLNYKGYYKAYHMNKKNWISVILDDTIKDKDIFRLIDYSYDIVNSNN